MCAHRLGSLLHGLMDQLQQRVEVPGVFTANAQIPAANMPQQVDLSALSLEPQLVLCAVRYEGVVLQDPLHFMNLLQHEGTPRAAAIVHGRSNDAIARQSGAGAVVHYNLSMNLFYFIERKRKIMSNIVLRIFVL